MPPLSRDDLETLSAYLDGALSAQERAALDSRLAAESELRTALDDLRRTVHILRAAPRLAVPRNYTLDPARFAQRAPWWMRLDVFRTMGLLGAAASTALIVLGVLLGQSRLLPVSAPQTSQSNEIAMQASRTDEEAVEQRSVAPTQVMTLTPVGTSTPAAEVALVPPSPSPSPAASPSPAPLLAGEDAQAASRQADNEAASGLTGPPNLAPGALPPSPAEQPAFPTQTALANFAADSVEGGAAAPAAQTTAAAPLIGESGPVLAAQITATATLPPTRAPLPSAAGRLEPTVPAATTEKAAAPPMQTTALSAASATTTASPSPPSTSVALAPIPTQVPAPDSDLQALAAEDPLPRLLVVAGLSLLVVSAVTLVIGLARRSRP